MPPSLNPLGPTDLATVSTEVEQTLMPTMGWLPKTKFAPAHPTTALVLRTPLLTAIQEAIFTHRLTLLTAPAGYGKSALLAGVYSQLLTAISSQGPLAPLGPAQVGWLSLDQVDNHLPLFKLGLLQALHFTNDEEQSASQLITQPATNAAFVGVLINTLLARSHEPCVVFLDDVHRVEEGAIYQLLDLLLERLPAHIHLVMASRTAPPLALARLSSQGQLAEFRAEQLAFDLKESSVLLNEQWGLALSPSALDMAQRYTEGWAVGLYFVGMALSAHSPGAEREQLLTEFIKDSQVLAAQSYLYEYLTAEVLNQQPPSNRRVLLQSAVLAELTPAHYQAVTGHAQAGDLLEQLYRHNLFLTRVQVENRPGSGDSTAHHYRYRFQTIFAHFLYDRLSNQLPALATELHRRASRLTDLAWETRMHHALRGQAWPIAVALLKQTGAERLEAGIPMPLLKWLQALPATWIEQEPELLYLQGRSQGRLGHAAIACELLAKAFDHFMAAGDHEGQKRSLLYWAANLLLSRDAQATKHRLEQLRRYTLSMQEEFLYAIITLWFALDEATPHWKESEKVLLTLFTALQERGLAEWAQHNLQHAMSSSLLMMARTRTMVQAIDQPVAPQLSAREGWWIPYQANLRAWECWLQGSIEHAEEILRYGLTMCHQFAPTRHPIEPELVLLHSAIQLLRQETASAQQTLQAVRTQPCTPTTWLLCTYELGQLYAQQGQLVEARLLYHELRTQSYFPVTVQGQLYTLLLDALIEFKSGAYTVAEERLQSAIALTTAHQLMPLLQHPRLLLAYLYLPWKGAKAALELFLPLLQECQQQHTVGQLYHGGPMTVALCQAALRQRIASPLVIALLNTLERAQQLAPHHVPDHRLGLSRREVTVLQLLVAGASNRLIAERLEITLPTVKSHLTRLFNKLNVTSRQAAVLRARELGL